MLYLNSITTEHIYIYFTALVRMTLQYILLLLASTIRYIILATGFPAAFCLIERVEDRALLRSRVTRS